ncbi:MAG TPA: methyltransferase [Dongiaceae bacterium]
MTGKPGFDQMRRLIAGYSVTIAISAVTELGIPDRLAEGPRDAAALAREAGVNEDFLRRVLRYLASEGVFEERPNGAFALTPQSQWLRAGVPGSMRPRAVFAGSAMSWSAWGSLLAAMKVGRSGMEAAFGETVFAHVKTHLDAAAVFNTFMATQTAASNEALLASYSFAGVREMVDVGGGRGALIAGALRAEAGMRGILFDMPEVVASAPPLLAEAGVADRCRVVGGDFFQEVPQGADLYALKFILHDWSDAACVRILTNCRRAMVPGGRVLIVEHIVPDGAAPHFARFMDINMLVMTDGGRERTQQEFERLVRPAGLRLGKVVPTEVGISALECVAV